MRHILHIIFYKGRKEYVACGILLVQDRTLVFFCFTLRLKAALAGMPVFSGPVGIVEGGIPHGFAVFEGVFVSGHFYSPSSVRAL